MTVGTELAIGLSFPKLMKKWNKILITIVLLVAGIGSAVARESIVRMQSGGKYLYTIKTESKKGMSLVIYSSAGTRIFSEKVVKRRLVIDFSNVQVGEYIICLKKNNQVLEHRYIKI